MASSDNHTLRCQSSRLMVHCCLQQNAERTAPVVESEVPATDAALPATGMAVESGLTVSVAGRSP